MAGASPEERQHLHLLEKTHYRYLGQRSTSSRPGGAHDDDAVRFDRLKLALKTIGLSKRHVAQTCQLVAAILHLGNLEFTIDRHRNEDSAVVRNSDLLELVSDFLGVQSSALEAALSYKTKLVKKELCTIFLDADGASDNRDDLAKTLYSLLFAWLNEHINQRLCRDDFTTFIGLFDLPGPQNMSSRPNSLDQFCINFANERLQNSIQKRLFESHVNEYTMEGISRFVPHVPYFDNSECIRLLQNKPGGLIHIMDDQARRAPKKTNATMVDAFQKRWANHSSFKIGDIDRSGHPTFTVNHFNGSVTYSSESFLERNLDALNPDFVSLFRGTSDGVESPGSINPFVKGLFSGKAIATQAHPRNEDTIVSAQQPVKPMRAPSTRRKNTTRRMPTVREGVEHDDREDEEITTTNIGPSSGGIPCVAGEFRSALDTLFETLDETQPWFVFCVNPNDSQLPNQLEGRSVKGQVRSAGLTEIAKRCATFFEAGMTPDEFCERYKEPLDSVGVVEGDARERTLQAATAFSFGERDIVLGQHKVSLSNGLARALLIFGYMQVFLTQRAFQTLEDELRSRDSEEQKRNRIRDAEAEAGVDLRGIPDIYAPYPSPVVEGRSVGDASPFSPAFGDASKEALPLVAHASPFQRADLYEDEYEERQTLRSDEYDRRSRFTSHRDDSVSNFGTESYAPSRNMFKNADKKALVEKEILAGELQEGETAELLKETSARRRWVALCWVLTWWVPTPCLSWFGRMKRMDVQQAWREKLALNMLIWFICACAVFVIAVLGNVICPTQHVFSSGELASHSFRRNPNNVFTSIRGEVFDLTQIAATHTRVVGVVPAKSILLYGGTSADSIFPVQVRQPCDHSISFF